MSLSAVTQRLNARSQALLLSLENRLDDIMLAWLFLAGVACAARVMFSSVNEPVRVAAVFPYLLLVLGPVASIVLALRWFADGDQQPQPRYRLARAGRWRDVDRAEARRHALYGASGIMVSLLVGILVNVPFRALEYLGAMPAIFGPVPPWLSVLHSMMTLDVVLMTSLYSIAFVSALRHVPLFPRLLVAIWSLDLVIQLATADIVSSAQGLPPDVAGALQALLDGNVKKALISMTLWMPYLLLSERVNVTYRSRVPAY